MQKRVVAIHDISCVGKCSLTVALPILSAAGLEASVLPTAVLSTHTGGFSGFTYRDLTSDILPIVEHWKKLNLRVDALYTGYLGSFEQIELVSGIFDTFRREDMLILVDPVMGDHGELYATFTKEYSKGMARLCAGADIIVPNLTEAALLLERPYVSTGYDEKYIEDMLVQLSELGPKKVVLSGVSFAKGEVGAASYDHVTGEFGYFFAEEIEGRYHGTGDIFASVLLAAVLREKTLSQAIEIAVSFTVECIQRTKKAGTDVRFGVEFETVIPSLIQKLC